MMPADAPPPRTERPDLDRLLNNMLLEYSGALIEHAPDCRELRHKCVAELVALVARREAQARLEASEGLEKLEQDWRWKSQQHMTYDRYAREAFKACADELLALGRKP